MTKHIVVIGGGFAGLSSATGAASKLSDAGVGPDAVQVSLVERNDYHNIRVRNYEPDPDFIVPLAKLTRPIDVRHVQGEATHIDPAEQTVSVQTADGEQVLTYDRLVLAAGSHLVQPAIPGLQAYAFNVDTHQGARTLAAHLQSLPEKDSDQRYTALVIGAGLTGVETACDLPERLARVKAQAGDTAPVKVMLADSRARLAEQMGAEAQTVIEQALDDLGIEKWPGVQIGAVNPQGVTLTDGREIKADTVIWTAGMQASELTKQFGVATDAFGRVEVDNKLRLKGVPHVFATGDTAWFEISPGHGNVMSCQHGRPMGRFAGHNVAADLLGEPLKPLQIDWYVTVLDLGPWGAVYCEGWDRHVAATGQAAKKTKRTINQERIYPPQNGDREAILAFARTETEAPPEKHSS